MPLSEKADMNKPLLREILPEFAVELETLLRKENYIEYAEQIAFLRITERCRCEDNFCGMFYTQPRPQSLTTGKLSTIDPHSKHGMILLEIVEESIAAVEVLFRPDVRKALLKVLP